MDDIQIGRRLALSVSGIVLAIPVVLIVFYSQWQLRSSLPVDVTLVDTLRASGLEALTSKDVPVSAVVLLGRTIIGKGHNVVQRDGSAGGHAEIEALSDAFRRVGFEPFMTLDRDSLVLVTTFEPCAMCRGALLEYRVKHVIFLKGKPVLSWLRENLATLAYFWERRQGGPSALQDSLVLVTTFEPCAMCRGALLEYRVKHVIFLKGKPVLSWLRENLATLAYFWERRQGGPSALQDSLFRLHPQFQ